MEQSAAATAPAGTFGELLADAGIATADRVGGEPFVGRAQELATLERALARSAAGQGCVCILTGEAGIGKTRTSRVLGEIARRRGADVCFGRCPEQEGAPPFWPWIELLRELCTQRGDALGPKDAAQLAAEHLPEWRGGAPTRGASSEPEPSEARRDRAPARPRADAELAASRFQLFDAVTRLLVSAARTRPLVLVVDDLHCADAPSLRLLRFFAQAIADAPILLVVLAREIEEPSAVFAETIAELGRLPHTSRLELRGLGVDAIAALARASGLAASGAFAAALLRHTDGNPLFAAEVTRWLIARGVAMDALPSGELPVPRNVQSLLGDRISALQPASRRILQHAAVIGRAFEPALLAEIAATTPGELAAALVEATRAHLLAPAGDTDARRAFSHALVREVLYGELEPAARRALHLRVAQRLAQEARAADPSALAYHAICAGPASDARSAARHAQRAGEAAMRALAFEEAALWFERGLAALRRGAGSEDAAWSDELELALGRAELRSGDTRKARVSFQRVAERARRRGAWSEVARAALGLAEGFAWFWGYGAGTYDAALVALLEEALSLVPADEDKLRGALLGQLALALYWSERPDDRERIAAATSEAVALARRAGEPTPLLRALVNRHWSMWSPDDLAERLALADEIARGAREAGVAELELVGHEYRFVNRLEAADLVGADAALAAYARLADELGQPSHRWYIEMFRATRALIEGRCDAAERHVARAAELGGRARSETVVPALAAQLFALRREQRRLPELAAATRSLAEAYPRVPAWRCGLARVLAAAGRSEEARAQLEPLLTGADALPRDNVWLVATCAAAETAVLLGDRPAAAQCHERLLPFAGRIAVAGVGFFALGPVDLFLGDLAECLGRRDEAIEHWTRARALAERAGAPRWRERAEAGIARTGEARAAHPPAALLRCDGDFWTLSFGGRGGLVRDLKGLHHLRTLLAHPEREFAAATLVDPRRARDAERGAHAEHARLVVTQRIKAALRRIAATNPELGRYLFRTVHTGYRCRYAPDPGDPVAWSFGGSDRRDV
jgi:hypothetical protein